MSSLSSGSCGMVRTAVSRFLGAVALSVATAATFTAFAPPAAAQWVERPAPTTVSMRGLSIVSEDVVWASGPKGTFLWTNDRGANWHVGTVPGAESFDFRDIHAVSLDTVYLMAAGQDTARIYKTTDRGKTWALQYDDTRKGVFLDAIAFFDATHGIALGDPIDGRFMILRTEDGGAHWTQIDTTGLPRALPREAAFAASGTSLVTLSAKADTKADAKATSQAWFATGAAEHSRVFISNDMGKSWRVYITPLTANAQSKGAFSIVFWNAPLDKDKKSRTQSRPIGVVVGGDYANPDTTAIAVATTNDGGESWNAASPSPATGYLSGVAVVGADTTTNTNMVLIGVGTQGTAVSRDGGRTWTQVDQLRLNTVMTVPGSRTVWAVGERGKIVTRSDL